MAQNDFLERHPRPKAKRPSAQPADRPRGHIDRPRSLIVQAQFGVQRTILETQRLCRPPRRLDHFLDLLVRQSRRRDVDRLLEKRTIQRIRLVEDGQRMQLAIPQQALQRDFRAWDVPLH